MAEVVVEIPEDLKSRISHVDWVNWSSVASKAFSDKLKFIEEVEMIEDVSKISGIPPGDNRQVKESLVRDVIKSSDKTAEDLKSGKIKPMTPEQFNRWCNEL